MANPVGHHLEHAEHATHHAANDFDRKVAMTIAIVAAALAFVTTLSHRGHTDVLRLQGESNQFNTLANIKHTEAADQWAFYQAKNIRDAEYKAYIAMVPFLAKQPGTEAKADEAVKFWQGKVAKYEKELADQEKKARGLAADADDYIKKADAKLHESHGLHSKVNYYDAGEVGIELAMVLCSVAVLTKRSGFWLGGIGVFVLGVAIVICGAANIPLIPSGHHDDHHAAPADSHSHDAAPAKAGAGH